MYRKDSHKNISNSYLAHVRAWYLIERSAKLRWAFITQSKWDHFLWLSPSYV